ncbi:hypothetical protein WA026_000362 [Henosepilachna vigintioctopunctata]|uniref:Uncharacterized protein n=1 Tax=Henosepilachna vigintioctopunctata TaxID=420089 RepID=A0AAW1V080_9CUCU
MIYSVQTFTNKANRKTLIRTKSALKCLSRLPILGVCIQATLSREALVNVAESAVADVSAMGVDRSKATRSPIAQDGFEHAPGKMTLASLTKLLSLFESSLESTLSTYR